MKSSRRVGVAFTLMLGTVALCGACTQIFLGDLNINDHPDAADAQSSDSSLGNDADVAVVGDADSGTSPDVFVGPMGPVCNDAGVCQDCDGSSCTITYEQSKGAIYPVWTTLSTTNPNAFPQSFTGPDDAGGFFETTSKLDWQYSTEYEAEGGLVDLAGAQAYCATLGTGWRVPTRVEIATTAVADFDASAGRTRCAPDVFNPSPFYNPVITSTTQHVTGAIFEWDQTNCGFTASPSNIPEDVRCVNGTPKKATFVVTADRVWAVENALEWERSGSIFRSVSAAMTYCASLPPGAGSAWHLPKIEELYGIINPAFSQQYDPLLFPTPTPPDAAAPTLIASSTVNAYYPNGDPNYEAVAFQDGTENGTPDDAGTRYLLVRCVHTR